MILLVAEVQDYRANPNRKARGIIIEARLDKGRGPVATVLVKTGTLRVGDTIVAGTAYGRVRAMVNDRGERVKEALPSDPVEVIGFNDVPEAGDIITAVDDDSLSRRVAEERKDKLRAALIKNQQKASLDDLFSQISAGQIKDLNLIIKADVQGSVEAVKQSLEKLSNDEVRVRCIHGGVGAITETDIMLASASNAIIIGFNVRPDNNVREIAEREKIDIRLYRVIYNAIEDVEKAMKGMLAPKFREVVLGSAQVRQVFKVTGAGTVAGCYVTDGKVVRNAQARLLRDSVVIHEGKVDSLKRFKDDAREVAAGYECGMGFEKLQRHQGRRRHRVLPDGGDRAVSAFPEVPGYTVGRSWRTPDFPRKRAFSTLSPGGPMTGGTMAGFDRIDRISAEVARELDRILRDEVHDPRLGGTWSILRAEVTRDLRYCKVRVSVLEPEKRKDVMAALKSAAGFIRRELGRRVELRYVPELLFEMDTNIEYAAHISEILRREEEKDERHHP